MDLLSFLAGGEVAPGESESLVKIKKPEDKRKRPYHHPDDRMIHYQYGRYQFAAGEEAAAAARPALLVFAFLAPFVEGYISSLARAVQTQHHHVGVIIGCAKFATPPPPPKI